LNFLYFIIIFLIFFAICVLLYGLHDIYFVSKVQVEKCLELYDITPRM